MTPPLEEELAAGMRDAVAELHTNKNLFDGALADHRRRTIRRRAAATGAVALLIAGAIGVAVIKPFEPPPPDLSSTGYVLGQTGDALEKGLIRYSTFSVTGWPTEGQITESWYDARTGYLRTYSDDTGNGVVETLSNEHRPGYFVQVNSTHRTWYSQDLHDVGAPLNEGYEPPPETAAEIRATVKKGQGVRIVGQEQVNGHTTIHIHIVLKRRPTGYKRIVGEPTYDLWVDKETFLPARSLLTVWVDANPKYFPGGKDETTEKRDYEWLPRTRENLARTRLTVPQGYTRCDLVQGYSVGPDGEQTPTSTLPPCS